MRTGLALLTVATVFACTRNAPAPLRPVAMAQATPAVVDTPPAPTTQAQAQGTVQAPVQTPVQAQDTAARQAPTAPIQLPPNAIQRTNRDSSASHFDTTGAKKDSLQPEADFLDSLHAAAPDTTHRQALTVPVDPGTVHREAAALFGRPAGVVASATWDIDVASYASHERVQYWMEFFTGRSRWHFERYIERAGRYDSMIRTRLGAAGMPQDMIYLAMIESGFAQNIRSRAGAVGLWQFMPSTGRRYGLTVDAWVDERRDPYIATDAAVRFLSELNNRFGSWYLAAAAYNSGPGRIERGLARGDFGALNGNDAFFAMAEGTTFLRRETRDYVPKLIAAALLAKEPEKYGFTGLDVWSPQHWDSVQVTYAVGLDVLARLAHTTRDDMEDLNPSFYRGVTPPDRHVWVRVPVGMADSVAGKLATLPERDRVTVLLHTVSRGETISGIAHKYGVRVQDIQSANHLRGMRLARGQELVIPTSFGRVGRVSLSAPTETVRRRPAPVHHRKKRTTTSRSSTPRSARPTSRPAAHR